MKLETLRLKVFQPGVIAAFGYTSSLFPLGFKVLVLISVIANLDLYYKALSGPLGRIALTTNSLVTYLFIQTSIQTVPVFETPEHRWLDFIKWFILLAGYLPLATWLRGDPRRIILLLTTAIAGLFTGLLVKAPLADLLSFNNPDQTGFHLGASASGLYSAATILGLLTFGRRMYNASSRPMVRIRVMAAWVTLGYLASFMLVSSQSRGSYLGAIIAIPLALWLQYRETKGTTQTHLKIPAILSVPALGFIVIGLMINQEALLKRMQPDVRTITTILRGESLDLSLPESSFAYRFEAQKTGIRYWLQKPLIGWGPISSKSMIMDNGDKRLILPSAASWISHFHNGYIDFLVRFGIIGTTITALSGAISIRDLHLSYRKNGIPIDYRAFLAGSVFLLLIWGLSGIFTSPWISGYIILLMATSYSLALPTFPHTSAIKSFEA